MIIPMKIISNPLTGITPDYPIENLGNRDEFLFLDIETTGLSAEFSMIYLIGCCYYERGRLTKRQWFAECPDDEAAILEDFSAFLSGRFTIDEIIGKAVIVHSSPDDFTTQPSGNAGEKIACGIIKEL